MINAVLGNHDYRGDAEAQLSPVLRKIDSRWLCLRSFIVNARKPTLLTYLCKMQQNASSALIKLINILVAEIVDFFFVDTTPFVDDYFTNPKNHTYDWRGVTPREDYLSNLLKVTLHIILILILIIFANCHSIYLFIFNFFYLGHIYIGCGFSTKRFECKMENCSGSPYN